MSPQAVVTVADQGCGALANHVVRRHDDRFRLQFQLQKARYELGVALPGRAQ